ncbi:MAG: sigma factor-like helix-turn-helix DNA-binding protein, partial [Chloroflexota bacterium]
IRELADYTDSLLLRLKNLGRKSVVDIAMAIITAVGERPESVDLVKSQDLVQRQTKFLKHLKERIRVQATESSTFENALLELFKHLDCSNSMVIKHRMGYGAKPETLEEIGLLLGVTRERVRQIEMNICDKEKSKPFWCQRVEEPIKRALLNRDTPLPVVALDIIDPWFASINKLEESLKYVLEKFCSNAVSVVNINGFSYLSAIDQEEWDSAVKEAYSVLEHGVSHNWKQSEAKYAVSSILPKKALELCDELFFAASKNAIFSVVDECDEPILTGIGRGADVYVEAVMFESDRPLHFTEIFDRIVAKGRQIDTRRAHNAASEIGLLYGRGTYGLMKHYPLSEEETQEMIDTAEEIIALGTEGRQWHCSELLEIMSERGLDMDGRLTQYIINIGLGRSKTLVDLRRLVWMAGKTATRITASDRIEVRQAIESLLRIEGKPLSGPEIRKRLLMEGRGVSGSFQIHEEGSIIRVGKNFWGLVDRDIPFSIEQQKMITEILEATLYRTQKGIHKTEIYEVLKEMPAIELFSTVDPTLFISIALSTGRMRYAAGNYLCLSDWSDTRRLTTEEAVRIALEEAGPEGLLTKDLKELASKIMGVQISSDNIYARLSAIGARLNSDTNQWQIMTGED